MPQFFRIKATSLVFCGICTEISWLFLYLYTVTSFFTFFSKFLKVPIYQLFLFCCQKHQKFFTAKLSTGFFVAFTKTKTIKPSKTLVLITLSNIYNVTFSLINATGLFVAFVTVNFVALKNQTSKTQCLCCFYKFHKLNHTEKQ